MQLKTKDKIKLDEAYTNYRKIIEKDLPYKFSYLEEWTLKKSEMLLDEVEKFEKCIPNKFKVYKRGTLIKVNFGVGLGSEMSQIHFAIVLNNYDNPKNNVLTVIPLTSKANNYNLDLGNLVIGKLIEKIKKELINLGINEELNNDKIYEEKRKKLNTLLTYYNNNFKTTYACCDLITTISKSRIIYPINEYDIIGREKCSNEVMDKIDYEISKRFTKISWQIKINNVYYN